MEINREPVRVLYLETDDMPAGIQPLFDRVIAAVDRPRKRACYGASTGPAGIYRACLQKLPGDDAARMGLLEWELPGGLYAVERVADWRSDPGKIAAAFQRLIALNPKWQRAGEWGIEEYLADGAVNVLLPMF